MKRFLNVSSVSPFALFLQAAAFLFLGIFLIVDGDTALIVARWFAGGTLLLMGVSRAFSNYLNKKKKESILSIILYIVGGAVMFLSPSIAGIAAATVFGLWFIISGIARATVCFQSFVEKLKGTFRYGFFAVISIVFGVLLLINPNMYLGDVCIVSGVYLIISSVSLFVDCLSEMLLLGKVGDNLKRRIRIPMPMFLTVLLPGRVIDSFNEYFAENKESVIIQKGNVEADSDIKLEVFIHLSDKGMSRSGHVDLMYDGTVYSYGCYDIKAHRFFNLLSDGTLVIVPVDKYIPYCTKFEGKVLAGFQMVLNAKQNEALKIKLEEIKDLLIPWDSDYEKYKKGLIPKADFTDPASTLVEKTGAKIYKIREGKFKTYYTLSTNCVQLADEILGSAGLDVLTVNGIITPGAYYSMLNELFERKNTMVATRTYYRGENTSK